MSLSSIAEEPEERIKEWLNQLKNFRLSTPLKVPDTTIDTKSQIDVAAYYLSLEKHSYDELCWHLAEKVQKKTFSMPNEEDIRKKAEEIFNLSKSYDELCWLNAEFDILSKDI
ncbi:MAG: hypothetical protein ACFFDY_14635 [Candidatus Thorarchaeota archaeon]